MSGVSFPAEGSFRSSASLSIIYRRREQEFMKSLERILKTLATDKITKQLLADETSSNFLAKRIEEVIDDVLNDDREEFIKSLLDKIDSFEKSYQNEYAAILRVIGNKNISISDTEIISPSNRTRQVQSLIDETIRLQNEVDALHKSIDEKNCYISDLKSARRLTLVKSYCDERGHRDNHKYAEVDMSDLQLLVIDLANSTAYSQKYITNMIDRMKKIIKEASNSSRQAIAHYGSALKISQNKYQKKKEKLIEMHSKYEDEIIPQLQAQANESISKLKAALTDRTNELQQTKNELNNSVLETSQLKTQRKQSLELIEKMKEQESIIAEQFEAAKSELQKLEESNESLENQNSKLKSELSRAHKAKDQLVSMKDGLTEDLDNLQDQLGEKEKQILKLQKDLKIIAKQLKEEMGISNSLREESEQKSNEINELKEKLNESTQNNRELMNNLQDSSADNNSKKERIHDLEMMLEYTKSELSASEEKYERKKNEFDEYYEKSERIKAQLTKDLKHSKKIVAKLEEENDDHLNMIELQKNHMEQNKEEKQKSESALKERIEESKDTIAQLTEEIKVLNNEIELLQTQVVQKNTLYENANNSLQKTRDDNMDLKLKLEEMESDKQKAKSMLEESKNTIAGLLLSKEIDKDESARLSESVLRSNDTNNALSKELRKLKRQNEQLQSKITELSQLNENYENEYSANASQIRNLKDQLNRSSESNKILKQKFDEVTESDVNNSSQLSTLLANVGAGNPSEGILLVRKLKQDSNILEAMKSALAVGPNEDPIKKAAHALNAWYTLKQVEEALGAKKNAVKVAQLLKEEHITLENLFKAPDDVSLTDTIREYMIRHEATVKQLMEANDYIRRIVSIVTETHTSPKKSQAPMSPSMKDRLITIIISQREAAKEDRESIERVLQKALQCGYSGSDLDKAVNAIAKRAAQYQKESILSSTNRQMDDLNNVLRAEQDGHQRDAEKMKRKAEKLRTTILELTEKNNEERKEFESTRNSLEMRISELEEEVKTEKAVKDELLKVSRGGRADKKFLQTKLNDRELKLVDLLEKLAEKDLKSKSIREDLKRTREERLGVINH